MVGWIIQWVSKMRLFNKAVIQNILVPKLIEHMPSRIKAVFRN